MLSDFARRHVLAGALAAVAALACTACAPVPPAPPPPPPPEPATVYVTVMTPEDLAAQQLLGFQAAISRMNATDLGREVAKLGDNPAAPADAMKLALALSYTHASGDLARAQGLLDRVLNNSALEAQAWHGLARLLVPAFADQRKAEEQIEKLNQQLRDTQRDNQRKLDQLNEKLEALKSIERSLTNRAPAAVGPFFSSPPAQPAPATAAPGGPVIKPASKP